MNVLQTPQHHDHPALHIGRRKDQRPILDERFHVGIQEFQHQIQARRSVTAGKDVQEGNDIVALHLPQEADFSKRSRIQTIVASARSSGDLDLFDGDFATCRYVNGEKNGGVRTFTDLFDFAV